MRLGVQQPDFIAACFNDAAVHHHVHKADSNGKTVRVPWFSYHPIDGVTVRVQRSATKFSADVPVNENHCTCAFVDALQSTSPFARIEGDVKVVAAVIGGGDRAVIQFSGEMSHMDCAIPVDANQPIRGQNRLCSIRAVDCPELVSITWNHRHRRPDLVDPPAQCPSFSGGAGDRHRLTIIPA